MKLESPDNSYRVWFFTLIAVVLIGMIVYFISRQSKLHEQYGKPDYPSSYDDAEPSSKIAYKLGVAGTAVGCWVWVFVLASINQSWIVLALGVALLSDT